MLGIDLAIVLFYFAAVFIIAISGRQTGDDVSSEDYFLSGRNLRWYSIAISTIATNIAGAQLLGMMGSAYLYGLAQAMFEVNAVQGILMAAFIFIPLYLREGVYTITQFISSRLGPKVALLYTSANIIMFATLSLGMTLFWGAYAAELVFSDFLMFISDDQLVRMGVLIAALGIFSAIYTYFGGLAAVVRTDLIQFAILTLGGLMVMFIMVNLLGGWSQLYVKTPELMHLHLPADHPKLPWIAMFGLFFLNINYWCANQSSVQRSLAAKSLKEAQIGLMVGGVLKYLMAAMIIIPGIALAGVLANNPISDPDMAFPYIVSHYVPTGFRGIILCAVFASLMSTVDSLFNSLATLWSVDIYKVYIKPDATDTEMVTAGRRTIIVALVTGVIMGLVLMNIKFTNPESAFTHTLNELRYYFNCGFVVLICSAAFLMSPRQWITLLAFLLTVPVQLLLKEWFPDMNYLFRAMWVILVGLTMIAIPTIIEKGNRPWRDWFRSSSPTVLKLGMALLASLIMIHIVFH